MDSFREKMNKVRSQLRSINTEINSTINLEEKHGNKRDNSKNQGYNSNNLNVPKSLKATAQKLCFEYNQTGPDEAEKRREILKKLLGKCSDLTFIEPSFHCDYGLIFLQMDQL